MAHSPDLSSQIHSALKSLQMYSAKHTRTQGAIEELTTWLHRRLTDHPVLHLAIAGGRLLLDGTPADDNPSSQALTRELTARRIAGVTLQRGVTSREIGEVLELLNQRAQNLLDLGGADRYFEARHCPHVQIRSEGATNSPPARPAPSPLPMPPQAVPPQAVPPPPIPAFSTRSDALPLLESEVPLEMRVEMAVRSRLLDLGKAPCQALFREILDNSLLETFFHAVEQILGALDSQDPTRVLRGILALEALATLEDPPSLPRGTLPLLTGGLLDCLHRRPDEIPEVAVEALAALLAALGLDDDPASVRAFLARVKSEEFPFEAQLPARLLLAPALAHQPLLLFFRQGRGVLDGKVLPYFREFGEEGARLLARLLGEEPNRQRRNRLLELLKGLGPLSLPALQECLRSGPWYLTRNALNLLGDMAAREAFEAVIPCLEHPDLRVRRATLRALWRLGGQRAEPYLLDFLQRSDPDTQIEILFGLGQIRASGAIPAIGALASHAPEALRIKALDALGEIGNPSAIPTLAEHLKRPGRIFKSTESPEVRLAAAKALGAIGTPEALTALTRAVDEAPRNGDQVALRKILDSQSWTGF